VWQKLGLATYLICILLKQHQGIPPGSFDDSVLFLQASWERTDPTRSFYLKLRFISHDLEDNGLCLTSKEIQKKVINFLFAWVSSTKMTLFKLTSGQLILPAKLDVVDLMTTSDLVSRTSWKGYVYAQFPFYSPSMKRIESYLDICPILR
jgi:hypothetical protein